MEKILLHFYRLIDNTNNIFFVIDVIDKPIISRKFSTVFFVIDVIDKSIISIKYFAHFFVNDVNE